MPFIKPIDFVQAINANDVKQLLPTTLSSAQLRQLPSAIKRSAEFSARVTNARYLQGIKDTVQKIIKPKQVRVGVGRTVTRGMDKATARLALKDLSESLNVKHTDARIDLITRVQTQTAWGFGNFIQGQSDTLLFAFPAQELYRAGERIVPRDWIDRWSASGGRFYEGDRMIAAKDDQIWQEIADYPDGLGNPYPPFAFNSGMDVRDISREEALALGVIEVGDEVEPTEADFSENIEADISGIATDLRESLLEELGSVFKIVRGVLQLKNRAGVDEPATYKQKLAGNYKKRHVRVHGLNVSIESPKGTVRSGKNKDGKWWASVMPADYGYIRRTKAKDNDQVDVYLGRWRNDRVWVVDQHKPGTREFDEPKCFINFPDRQTAIRTYNAGFSDGSGPQRMGDITEMSVPEFKDWVFAGKKSKPAQLAKVA